MRAIALVLLVLSCSLVFADVVQVSDNTYVIRRTDKGGIFGNTAKMRDKVLLEAQNYARARGKIAETVTLSETGKGFMRFAAIEYTFRLVDAESGENKEESVDLYTELKKLAELRDEGILTDAEFEAEKKKLLDAN